MSKKDALRDLGLLLEKLVPPDEVEIQDIDGKVYKLPTRLPARRQIKALRHINAVLALPASGQVQDAASRGSGDVVAAFVQIASDDTVACELALAFSEAHPDVCGGADPLDLFPIEEIVAGLLPTFARSVARAGRAIAGAMSDPDLPEA